MADRRQPLPVLARLTGPFGWAFAGTIGVLLALAIGAAATELTGVLVTIVLAVFLTLALDPVVRSLEARGLTRGRAVAVVFAGIVVVTVVLLAWIVPATVGQVISFAQSVPASIARLEQEPWFQRFTGGIGGEAAYASLLAQLQAWLSDPAHLLAVGTGVFSLGSGLVNGISGSMIVLVLALYFLASLDEIKEALYLLLPRYRRPKVAELTEKVTAAVGGFVAGGVQLSSLNAAFSFVLLALIGAPYPLMLAFGAWLVTLIPMVGSVLFWLVATGVCLLNSWVSALVFAIVYFAYMQLEAYIITPRIMGRAVSVPGPLVLIGALVGGTLFGLLGALVAVPLTASALIILRGVYLPRQNAMVAPPATSVSELPGAEAGPPGDAPSG